MLAGAERILIVGCGGAGKSTLARRLGPILGLPVVHLDQHFWRPGWVETPRDEWVPVVKELVAKDRWIMDGNYGGTLGLRCAAADTLIFLDLPRRVCLYRALARAVRHRRRTRPDLAPDCPERFDPGFLYWIWSYRRLRRPGILETFETYREGRRIHVLPSARAVESFLGTVAAEC